MQGCKSKTLIEPLFTNIIMKDFLFDKTCYLQNTVKNAVFVECKKCLTINTMLIC